MGNVTTGSVDHPLLKELLLHEFVRCCDLALELTREHTSDAVYADLYVYVSIHTDDKTIANIGGDPSDYWVLITDGVEDVIPENYMLGVNFVAARTQKKEEENA